MSETRSKSWWKISCIGCVGLPCLSLMLAFGWIKCQVGKIGDQLPNELAALKKMGVPVEPADLSPNPPVPDRENAKFLIDDISKEYLELGEDRDVRAAREATYKLQGAPPEDNPAVMRGYAKLLPLLEKVDGLAAYRRVDFKRDYSLGPDLQLSENPVMSGIAKWQSIRSRVCLKQGDQRSSLAALASIFAISRLCTQQPESASVSTGLSIDSVAHTALANHLENIKSNPSAIDAARGMMESFDGEFDIHRSLGGSIILGRVVTQKLRSWHSFYSNCYGTANEEADEVAVDEGFFIKSQDPMDRLTLGDPYVRRMFEAKFLGLWRRTFEGMPPSKSDWRGIRSAVNALATPLESDNSWENYLNKSLFLYPNAIDPIGMYQTRYRLSLLAIRLLQDRPSGLPNDLSKYGNLAIDPMDGKPIRYDRTGDGFKIWSVGRDEVDNKGVKFYPGTGMSNQNVDEVLHFFYPEKAPPVLKR